MTSTLKFAIDVFAVFNRQLSMSGWLFDMMPISTIELRSSGIPGGRHPLQSYKLMESSDVAAQYGALGNRVRFNETIEFDATSDSLRDSRLSVCYADGKVVEIGDLLSRQLNPAGALAEKFFALLKETPSGCMLEVGARARSGVVRRDLIGEGWTYTGLDVMDGPNVDIVGDVHEASSTFPPDSFDAVMAFSVLEHLLMPWKAIIELNHIMVTGGIGLFTTHQSWPLHDEPWDFWRFSDRAWAGLLNSKTGFEIIDAAMGEPAYLVAQRCHPVTNFGLQQTGSLAAIIRQPAAASC